MALGPDVRFMNMFLKDNNHLKMYSSPLLLYIF